MPTITVLPQLEYVLVKTSLLARLFLMTIELLAMIVDKTATINCFRNRSRQESRRLRLNDEESRA